MVTKDNLDGYFDICFYYSLSRFNLKLNKIAETVFKDLPIPPSYIFLMISLDYGELSSGELARITGIAPSTLTRFVTRLKKGDLVKCRSEGRNVFVSLTEKGKEITPFIREKWKELFDKYTAIYGKEKISEINRMLVDLNKISTKKDKSSGTTEGM